MTEKKAFPWERLEQQRGQSPGGVDAPPQEVRLPQEGEHHHQEELSLFILRSIPLKHSTSSKRCCEQRELMSSFDIRVHLSEPPGHHQTRAMGNIIASDPLSSTGFSLTMAELHTCFATNQQEAQINHFNICIS